jgi:transposase-like protein
MSQSQRTTRDQWRRRIAQQQSGAQSVGAFCRSQGVSENSFYSWKRRLRDDAATPFVELKAPSVSIGKIPPTGIEVRLRGRRRLLVRHGFDRDLLIELVRALEAIS